VVAKISKLPVKGPCRKSIEAALTKNPGTGAPTDIIFPLTIAKSFTVDTDYVTIKFPKPSNFIPGSDIDFVVNWTKSQDTNQSGKKAKWQIEYFFTDVGYDVATDTPDGTLSGESTYADSGTTIHIAHDVTSGLTIASENVQEDKNFLYVKLKAITPSSDELSEPVLLTICMGYVGYLSQVV